jgi:hypothetical protein
MWEISRGPGGERDFRNKWQTFIGLNLNRMAYITLGEIMFHSKLGLYVQSAG